MIIGLGSWLSVPGGGPNTLRGLGRWPNDIVGNNKAKNKLMANVESTNLGLTFVIFVIWFDFFSVSTIVLFCLSTAACVMFPMIDDDHNVDDDDEKFFFCFFGNTEKLWLWLFFIWKICLPHTHTHIYQSCNWKKKKLSNQHSDFVHMCSKVIEWLIDWLFLIMDFRYQHLQYFFLLLWWECWWSFNNFKAKMSFRG